MRFSLVKTQSPLISFGLRLMMELVCLAAWRPAFFGAWLPAVRFFCWVNAKGDEKMKKRVFSLVLALLLCVGLAVPVLAAEDGQGIDICWLDEELVNSWEDGNIESLLGNPAIYNAKLNWITCYGWYTSEGVETYRGFVVDLSTGNRVEQYDYMRDFSDDLAAVGKKDAEGNLKWGFINTEGEVVIPLEYDGEGNFSEGLAGVEKKDTVGTWKCGYINKKGEVVIPMEYEYVRDFTEGLALVGMATGEKDDSGWPLCKWGYINTKGEVAIPLEYDNAGNFTEGLAMVCKRNAEGREKYGYINTEGEVVVPLEYDYIDLPSFYDGLAATREVNAEGIWEAIHIDNKGQVVQAFPGYGYVRLPYEGLMAAGIDTGERNGSGRIIYKWGFINAKGEVVIPLEYDSAGNFSDGLADVCKKDAEGNEHWGYINKKGEIIIPLEYDHHNLPNFNNGLAAVKEKDAEGNDKWGYIDAKGKVVIPLEYDDAEDFNEGLARVQKADAEGNSKYGFINTKGEAVIPFEYDDADFLIKELHGLYNDYLPICWVEKDGQYGIFKNPYWQPEKEDAPSGTVGGGFPVVPVVIGVAIVAAAVVVLLVVKKKKAAPAPVAVTQTAPDPATTSDVPTAPAPVPPSSVDPAPAPTPDAEPPRFCSNCGKSLAPGVNFCSSCGYNVKDGEG